MKTYAEKLKELLKEHKLNYLQLEKELIDEDGYTTVTRQTISNHCKGKDPHLSIIMKLAKFFNVSPIYLIDDTIENKDSIENIEIGKVLDLSDTAINNIKQASKESKNLLVENTFFTSTTTFIEMIKDIKELNKLAIDYNKLDTTFKEKLNNLDSLQNKCNKFHVKFHKIPGVFNFFDSIGMWNILNAAKSDILDTKDNSDDIYLNVLNTMSHTLEKSIKVIHSDMKDSFVYFIDSI